MDRQNIVLASRVVNKSLREDLSAMRTSLKQLISVSKRNVEIQQKMDDLGDSVLQCADLETLVAKVTTALKDDFGLTSVTFSLSHGFKALMPEKEPEHIKSLTAEKLFFMDAETLASIFARGPVLKGRLERGSLDFFPLRELRRIRSQALIPLYFDGEYMGSFNLGSGDPTRYMEGVATDYLRRLAQVLSLAIANLRMKQRLAKKEDEG